MTCLLSEIGLNIQEAHAFSTVDGYSLDVFVVDGWPYEVFAFHFSNLYVLLDACFLMEKLKFQPLFVEHQQDYGTWSVL